MKIPQILIGEYGVVTVSSCTAHSWRYFCSWNFRDRNNLRITLSLAPNRLDGFEFLAAVSHTHFPLSRLMSLSLNLAKWLSAGSLVRLEMASLTALPPQGHQPTFA